MENKNVLIMCPDLNNPMYHGRWRSILDQLNISLRRFDIKIDAQPWTTPLQNISESVDLVLPLLAWGYQRAHRLWLEICSEWRKSRLSIQNPPHILQWNSDKRYLEELSQRGAPVFPSVYYDKISSSALKDAIIFFGVDTLVVKSTVSATAYKTSLWREGAAITDPPDGPCLIQPYLPSIVTEGEVSLIFIEGQFSHALRKTPAVGDFRVQPEFGGCLTPYVSDQSAFNAAQKVLSTISTSLIYSRIDLVLGSNNEWLLLEAELIESDLFWDWIKIMENYLEMRCSNI